MADERRSGERRRITVTTFLRKTMADGKLALMEFRSVNLSESGIFISTEDLGVLDLGEEVEILVSAPSATEGEPDNRYYEGRARVMRSARVFDSDELLTESGFGLMFLELEPEQQTEFRSAIEAALALPQRPDQDQ